MHQPFINITVPVYNEEKVLAASIGTLEAMLREHACNYEVVIANNASTDGTLQIARSLEAQSTRVRVLHLDEKGRGRAVKAAWRQSAADILCYMDVDLSTSLSALPRLIESLTSGNYDLAIGSRLLKESQTARGLKREVISRCYNLLVKTMFGNTFSDAQCGFKGITKRAAMELLPLVENDNWFMDTELLLIAERRGYRIADIPVRWVDDPDSRVSIWITAVEDIKGLIRLRRAFNKPGCNPALLVPTTDPKGP
jgi:glycosyltransferase involved in cell wall biosynthesis